VRPDYTDIYERKLLQRIAAQERAVSSLFNKFIQQVSPQLTKVRIPPSGDLWVQNPVIKQTINDNLKILQRDLKNYLQQESLSAWNLSNDKTDKLVSNYLEGTAINKIAKEGMFNRNLDAFQEFQKRKVAGMGLSARVWKVCDMTRDQLKMYVETGIATGRSAARVSQDVRQFLKNPDARFRRVRDPETGKLKLSKPMKNFHPGQGVYRSAYKNAIRMTRTETNMAYRLADMNRYRKLDFITGYEVRLSANHPEFDICDYMIGQYPKTFTFSGWHPNCFCYVVPVMLSKKEFSNYLDSGKVSAAKKIKGIPPTAARYVMQKTNNFKNYSSKPYWLKENFKLKDEKFVTKDIINKPPKSQGLIKDNIK